MGPLKLRTFLQLLLGLAILTSLHDMVHEMAGKRPAETVSRTMSRTGADPYFSRQDYRGVDTEIVKMLRMV